MCALFSPMSPAPNHARSAFRSLLTFRFVVQQICPCVAVSGFEMTPQCVFANEPQRGPETAAGNASSGVTECQRADASERACVRNAGGFVGVGRPKGSGVKARRA